MEEGEKMVRVILSRYGKENVEESVRSMFEAHENHEGIHGVQVVIDQVDAEEAIDILESLVKEEYDVNVTKMVIEVNH
jgi:hypothetical protein